MNYNIILNKFKNLKLNNNNLFKLLPEYIISCIYDYSINHNIKYVNKSFYIIYKKKEEYLKKK
jgi:hypothetical protein